VTSQFLLRVRRYTTLRALNDLIAGADPYAIGNQLWK
jgi:hypothetical protein